MRPRDMASRLVKILPWYYTDRRQPARATADRQAVLRDLCADGALEPMGILSYRDQLTVRTLDDQGDSFVHLELLETPPDDD